MDRKVLEALELLRQEQDVIDHETVKKSSVTKTLENKADIEEPEDQIEDLCEEEVLSERNGRYKVHRIDEYRKSVYGDLSNIYEKYREFYHIGDTKKIDLMLSTALSVGEPDKNIWILFVGASGVGKSLLTDPLRYVSREDMELAHMVSDMTTNTIVSGMASEGTSLAPKLDEKILYIPDFSTIVEKRSEDQREIFAQFRNLYDGFAKKNTGGYGEDKKFDVDVTLIGNVTPAIHTKNLIHQSMGTRFLYYEINDFSKKDVFESIWSDNEGMSGEEISKEIAERIQEFLDQRRTSRVPEVPKEVKEEIEYVAEWMAKMRATGQFDRSNDELRGTIHPEKPTRILKQFKKIYYNLKKLSDDYEDERALDIIQKIGASCVDPDKRRIYIEIDQAEAGLELADIVDRIGISRNTAKRRLLEMRNVGILRSDFDITESGRLQMSMWEVAEDYEGMSKDFVN